MTRRSWARAALMADGVGCALAAVGALAIGRLGDELDPISSARIPLGAALAVTSAMLLGSARDARDRDLSRAALVNTAWALGCTAALTARHTRTSRLLVATTAVADAAMAVTQWSLRSDRHGVGFRRADA